MDEPCTANLSAGVATGAVISSFSGAAGKGALIGAVCGYLYDQDQKSKQ